MQKAITFVINGNTYQLRADDPASLGKLAGADRDQLLDVLEAIRQQEQRAQAAAAQRAATAQTQGSTVDYAAQHATPKPERVGRGDVDALMARLAMEEKQTRSSGITRQGLYKFVGWTAAIIVLLVMIF
tara:strand:+ start:101179 stop:101565 length:387 start_codon:yes stop_codon:yes gene_type:complete